MKLIAITGGIGSGKSVVAEICRLKGFKVYDCDMQARSIMESDPEVASLLREAAGADVYDCRGSLCRDIMAERIFGDAGIREKVNSIVHQAVRQDLKRWCEREYDPLMFVETAIPVTSGLDRMCDAVWVVDAPAEVRMRRAMKRDNSTEEKIAGRMKAQADEFVSIYGEVSMIENDGIVPVLPRIGQLINTLITERKC